MPFYPPLTPASYRKQHPPTVTHVHVPNGRAPASPASRPAYLHKGRPAGAPGHRSAIQAAGPSRLSRRR